MLRRNRFVIMIAIPVVFALAWGTNVFASGVGASCLAFKLLIDPALREVRREQKRSAKQLKRMLSETFGDWGDENQIIREAFEHGNPLNRPENRVQSVDVQMGAHLPHGSYNSSKLSARPLDWELLGERSVQGGTRRELTVRNKVTLEQKTVEFPWDPAWEQRDQFFGEFPLKIEATGSKSLKEETPHFEERMRDPDFKLYHDRVNESRDAYEGGARQAKSFAIDLLVNQKAALESRDVRLPQYLWILAKNSDESGLFFQRSTTGKPFRQTSLRPFFLGPYTTDFSSAARSELAAPVSFTRYKGIEAFTVKAETLQNGEADLEHALRLMSSFLYWKQVSTQFRPGKGLESIGQSLSIVTSSGKPGIQVHYLDLPELIKLEEAHKSSGDRFKMGRPSWRPPVQYRHAPEDIRRYVMRGYREELKLSKKQLKEPLQISRKTANRTRYIFLSEEPFTRVSQRVEIFKHPLAGETERTIRRYRDFERFKIRGAMSIVESKGPREPLPMETYLGVQVERKTDKPIVELGRFYVDRDLRPVGPRTIWQVAYSVVANHPLEKVVAHTDMAYAEQLIAEFGFRKVGEKVNPRGKVDYIIEATPEEIFNVAVKGRAAPIP